MATIFILTHYMAKNDGEKGLENIILKFLHAGTYFPTHKIPKITNSVTKITIFLHGGISK